MPLVFAFKDALISASRNSPLDAAVDLEIARFTGGHFCHVEAWISGPMSAARCYSARQPHGTSIETIDLTDSELQYTGSKLWTLVPYPGVTPEDDLWIDGFCTAGSGRPYDFMGILGIGTDTAIHDPEDRFCSEAAVEIIQARWKRWLDVPRYKVAPSGKPPSGYGLFELLTTTQSA